MTEENNMAEEPITTDGATPELPEVEQAEPVTLGVADLQNAAQVIDVAVFGTVTGWGVDAPRSFPG